MAGHPQPWWKWPANKNKDYRAWYSILWRLPFVAVYSFGVALSTLCLWAMYGYQVAESFWEKNR